MNERKVVEHMKRNIILSNIIRTGMFFLKLIILYLTKSNIAFQKNDFLPIGITFAIQNPKFCLNILMRAMKDITESCFNLFAFSFEL